MDVKGGREKEERKEGRRRGRGCLCPQESEGGGEREPDVQEIEAKQVRWERHKK